MIEISLDFIIKTMTTIKQSKLSIATAQADLVKTWYDLKNEEKLRIDSYNPSKNDLIVDVGSFDGMWIKKFLNKHKECRAICYEPSKTFFEKSIEILKNHSSRITLNNFGLSDKTYQTSFNNNLGVASQEDLNNGNEIVQLVDITREFEKIDKIHLLKMNIEGDEYKCLESLVKNGLLHKIENMQIQFHAVGTKEETIERYLNLIKEISKTHYPVYYFPFIWEGWKLK